MNKNWLRTTIRDFEPYVVPEIKERIVTDAPPPAGCRSDPTGAETVP